MKRIRVRKYPNKKKPNLLFETWLEEWKKEASERDLPVQHAFGKALASLRKCPIPLATGRDCLILQNFGIKLCDMLDKKLEQHNKLNNLPSTSTSTSGHNNSLSSDESNSGVEGKKQRKKKSLTPNSNQPKNRKNATSKPYIPKTGSGAYAILVALFRKSQEPNYPGFMYRNEIISEAQAECDVPMKSTATEHYAGWSAMSTLVKKSYVVKVSNPAKYSLSDAGLALAMSLWEGRTNGSNSSDDSGAQSSLTTCYSHESSQAGSSKSSEMSRQIPQTEFPSISQSSKLRKSPISTSHVSSQLKSTAVQPDVVLLDDDDDEDDDADGAFTTHSQKKSYVVGEESHSADGHSKSLEYNNTLDELWKENIEPNNDIKRQDNTPPMSQMGRLIPKDSHCPEMDDIVIIDSEGDDNTQLSCEERQRTRSNVKNNDSFKREESDKDCHSSDDSLDEFWKEHNDRVARMRIDEYEFCKNSKLPSPVESEQIGEFNDDPNDFTVHSPEHWLNFPSPKVGTLGQVDDDVVEILDDEALDIATDNRLDRVKQYETLEIQSSCSSDNAFNEFCKENEEPVISIEKKDQHFIFAEALEGLAAASESQPTKFDEINTKKNVHERGKAPISTQRKKASKETPTECFFLLPNNFDIILLVDKQETSGSKTKPKDDATISELGRIGVMFEVRTLKIGDFAWVARCRFSNKELVLPYIVERKRIDDLSCSIMDGRYKEQKFRLKQSNIRHVIYMIENHGRDYHGAIPLTSLHQAAVNTLIHDSFNVRYTKNHKDSMHYLATMTTILIKIYEGKELMSCSKTELEQFDSRDENSEKLMEFTIFNKAAGKTKNFKVRETLVKHLMQLKGVSVDKAIAITEFYPTPKLLAIALRNGGETLLTNIQVGSSKRKIGPVISRTIHQLYTRLDL